MWEGADWHIVSTSGPQPDLSPPAGYLCVIHDLVKERTLAEYCASIQKNEVGIYLQMWKDVQNKSGGKARGRNFSLVKIPFL